VHNYVCMCYLCIYVLGMCVLHIMYVHTYVCMNVCVYVCMCYLRIYVLGMYLLRIMYVHTYVCMYV
jgi:hypothetical protein